MPPVKSKRVITARRREQNRDAQRAYRAKIRDRLSQLDTLQQTASASSESHNPDNHAAIETRSQHSPTGPSDETVPEAIGQDLIRRPSPSTSVSSQVDRSATSQCFVIRPYTSDPRLNHLTTPHISVISAGVENSSSLNLTKTEALTPGFQSPFYNPNSTADMHVLRPSWWSSIPRDLYPTSLQLSVPHQAWIDSIPVPSFRDGVLEYLATERVKDDQFNLSELADDIDGGGLICWGGDGTRSGGTGTPWDARSWEARPWFLMKWKHVTGGLEGELGAMSMWWWRLKGERFDTR